MEPEQQRALLFKKKREKESIYKISYQHHTQLMQESQLLWGVPRCVFTGILSGLTEPRALRRHRRPRAAELGWRLRLRPARVAPGDAQTKQLYIPRWQHSPVPLLAPELRTQPAGALGNNLVNVYSHVLYCKLTCYKTDLA